ncbi:uncharacterized protein BX663DRAFT_525113 [Cokeromyces recurvatus]|uniref:uncharacterized protein n=1 Tax=Cokeromyces recurvatus TaxID=90255 RepID=UPI00221E9E4E|nr:uncharacterized protein BX663DRAFT_525113 [Cokeromyces recurvatus]KAI7898380.1 hypothetical protein BX663DRAFT_525113 [Cokeromyces recurvatus]
MEKDIIIIDSDNEDEIQILSVPLRLPLEVKKGLRSNNTQKNNDESRLLAELLTDVSKKAPSSKVDVNKLFQRVDKIRVNLRDKIKKKRNPLLAVHKNKYSAHHNTSTTTTTTSSRSSRKKDAARLTNYNDSKALDDDHKLFPLIFSQNTTEQEEEQVYTFDLDPLSSSSDDDEKEEDNNFLNIIKSTTDYSPSHERLTTCLKREKQQPSISKPSISSTSTTVENEQPSYSDEEYDEAEADLEDYINYIMNGQKSKRLFATSNTRRNNTATKRVQCPLCYLFFSSLDILTHAGNCDGNKEGSHHAMKKKTMAVGVAKSEEERKKQNQGIEYIGNTNYYTDSDVVALDGSGFNNEVTSTSWESAGQIRFV